MITIGVIGGGFVGGATALLENEMIQVMVYDTDASKCKPANCTLDDMNVCSLLFVCVPTPMSGDGSCYTKIVETVIQNVRNSAAKDVPIVVRSTVPVGFCASQNVHFMPEFLTEANWKNDFLNAKEWIVGTTDSGVQQLFTQLAAAATHLPQLSKDVIFCTTSEGEMIKYFRNCFLATKVSFCNEIYQFCESKNIEYDKVRKIACADPRIGLAHTLVPGPDGWKGLGGVCLVKDSYSLISQHINTNPLIMKAVMQRNETIDRPQKEWLSSEEMKGRAVV